MERAELSAAMRHSTPIVSTNTSGPLLGYIVVIIRSAPDSSVSPPYSRNHSERSTSAVLPARMPSARSISSAKPSLFCRRIRNVCRNQIYKNSTGSAAGTETHAARPAADAETVGTSRRAGARKNTVHAARSCRRLKL